MEDKGVRERWRELRKLWGMGGDRGHWKMEGDGRERGGGERWRNMER